MDFKKITIGFCVFFLSTVIVAGQNYRIGWSVEFDDLADIQKTQIFSLGKNGDPKPSTDIANVKVQDGTLIFGANFDENSKSGQYIAIAWSADDGSLMPMDIKEFPMLEFRWRRVLDHGTIPQYNVIWNSKLLNGQTAGSYFPGTSKVNSSWQTKSVKLVSDGSSGGFSNRIQLEVGAQGVREPTYIEFDYIRIRDFTKEEAAAEAGDTALLENYKCPDIPERLKDVFFYGVFHDAPYVGGWDGYFDEIVRAHINFHLGSSPWAADDLYVAQAAKPLDLYIAPHSAASREQYTGKWAGAGPEGVRKTVKKQIKKTKAYDNIAGWFLVDEPFPRDIVAVTGIKEITEELDPDRLGVFVVNGVAKAQTFNLCGTVLWADYYPIRTSGRDPWSVTDFCRQIQKINENKRQWFTPQVFGDYNWYKVRPGYESFVGPSRQEFRLMMNLALANGVKGFVLFNYSHPYWMATADLVGNLTDLGREVSVVGEKFASIGPILLEAKPDFKLSDILSKNKDDKKALFVGALKDKDMDVLFLHIVNQDIKQSKSGRVALPASLIKSGNRVYDLDSLATVKQQTSSAFAVESLPPGGGRTYVIADNEHFKKIKSQILKLRIDEKLRVANADRVILQRWGLNLEKYDTLVAKMHKDIEEKDFASANKTLDQSSDELQKLLKQNKELDICRTNLPQIKKMLGQLNLMIYEGSEQIRKGQENNVDKFKKLSSSYSDLRRKYLLGNFAGWMDYREGRKELVTDIKNLKNDTEKLLN